GRVGSRRHCRRSSDGLDKAPLEFGRQSKGVAGSAASSCWCLEVLVEEAACRHLPRGCLGRGDCGNRLASLVEAAKPRSGVSQSGNIFWQCGYYDLSSAQTT